MKAESLFWITVLDKDGKVKQRRKYESITAPTKAEAEELKYQLLEAHKINPNEMTIREGINNYIESIRAVKSPKTIEGYEIIRDYAFSSIMDLNIKRLNNDILQRAINEECFRPSQSTKGQGKPISPKTLKNEWGLIAAVIRKYNPKFDIRVTLPGYVSPVNNISSPKEIFEIVKGTEIELPVLLAMWLSFTMSEVKGLTKSSSIKRDFIYIDEVVITTKKGEFKKRLARIQKETGCIGSPLTLSN